MKKLTKILVVVLSLVLALGCFAIFAGCNNSNEAKEYTAEEMSSWGDAMKLLDKMNAKGWFGANYAGQDHETTRSNFKNGKSLFMIEGSWSRWDAYEKADERMLIQMPTDVPANWIYEGSPAGSGDKTVVGGVTAGWMISRNAWNDAAKKEAAVAFITTVTRKGILAGAWAGNDSFDPSKLEGATEDYLKKSNLTGYSCAKMASSTKTMTAMDARLSPEAMTALRTLPTTITTDTKLGVVKKSMNDVYTANEDYYTPVLKYTAGTKGTKKVADIKDADTTLKVTTMFNKADWQNGCYETALDGQWNNPDDKDDPKTEGVDESQTIGIWGYSDEDGLKQKYPKFFAKLDRNDVKADNAIKDKFNQEWVTPSNMPDVLGWFSDAQAAVIRDDEHLVPVAEIQKEYGDYGAHLNAQFFDKYALPIVGTYEALFVNVDMLAGLDGFAAVKTAYEAYKASIVAADADKKIDYANDLAKKEALHKAVVEALDSWTEFEKACDAATKADKLAISQDRSGENNYIVDQAIMIMGGAKAFEFVPGAPIAK